MALENIDRARIAELRRKISAAKGIERRADDSAMLLRVKASRARAEIASMQREIESLGGKVRR